MNAEPIQTIQGPCPQIDEKQTLRYLGCRSGTAPAAVQDVAARFRTSVREAASCRACFTRLPVQLLPNGMIDLGFLKTTSQSLSRNLEGCQEVFLFAATLGFGPDRLIKAQTGLSSTGALAADAAGSTAVEAWCDVVNTQLKTLVTSQGLFLRPRFSPGYGDFKLEVQREILSFLNTPKRIGLSLTESMMLVPTKSVTALVGISHTPVHCGKDRCETCTLDDCPYRI